MPLLSLDLLQKVGFLARPAGGAVEKNGQLVSPVTVGRSQSKNFPEFAVCKDNYVVYSVDLTEWENENDSQNQCASMRITENHCKYSDLHISVSFGLGPLKQ